MDTTYDYIVIGKGLMGAAAARHLSAISRSVALVGPDEPADRATHQGIFGSHYDEGRITRILDPNRIWALLAQRSLARYRDIEAFSGVSFYHEVGHLTVGVTPISLDDHMARVQHVATELNVPCEHLTDAALAEQFPFLRFEPNSVGMYQPHTAGHVSPRAQVRAQTVAAQKQGATIIPEVAHTVEAGANDVHVITATGTALRGKQVLLATGGFSNTHALLPQPLDLEVYARTIVLMELDDTDVARLRTMPSIISKPREPTERCYLLPPIRYPDGKYYVKIGGDTSDPTLRGLDALQEWFRGTGRQEAAQHLTDKLHTIVPGLRPVSVHTESCVTTDTVTGQVYAERLDGGRLGVLIGGNGSAAKSADEIGRLGALMMQHESWAYDIDASHFRAHFATQSNA